MSLSDFRLTADDFGQFGQGLERPECVVIDDEGIWTSDLRGGIARVLEHAGPQIVGSGIGEPNGFSRRADGSFVVAGIGDGKVHLVLSDGRTRTLLARYDGMALGAVNYACADGPDRIWVSVMTRKAHWSQALRAQEPDGYILRLNGDGKSAEVVADGLDLTNEVKLSPQGTHLYAVETLGGRIVRFAIRADGSLGDKESVGPSSLGRGALPDGFSFDRHGNIWVTMISENGLLVIDTRGDVHRIYRDANEAALATLADGIETRTGSVDHLVACAEVNGPLRLPTSLAFGGADGRTCFVGSLGLSHLATFRLPPELG
ncbi:MAG: SMP-30/gluconolactonase/LRE family protein [Alphaproteobacteria bacterium]|nr:SMP-30/gluconolactonase/LRE family protein [Alphaproteobacteria bacterium]